MLQVHAIAKVLPPSEKYNLSGQIERSSKSVPDNIAQGNSSYYYNDKIKAFYDSRKEAGETQNHLREIEKKGYQPASKIQVMIDEYEEVIRGINGLINRVIGKRDSDSDRKGRRKI